MSFSRDTRPIATGMAGGGQINGAREAFHAKTAGRDAHKDRISDGMSSPLFLLFSCVHFIQACLLSNLLPCVVQWSNSPVVPWSSLLAIRHPSPRALEADPAILAVARSILGYLPRYSAAVYMVRVRPAGLWRAARTRSRNGCDFDEDDNKNHTADAAAV